MKSTHSGLSFAGLFSLIVLVALAACSGADETALPPTPDVTQVYQTVNARLTEAVILTPSVTAPPVPIATDTSRPATPTLSATLAATRTLAGNPTQPGNCDLAGAGNPIDISIPDDTRMQPGQAFTKIWRLQNLGTCTWTSSYLAGHFSGQMMTLQGTVPLPQQVPPGGSIDLAVDMVAPQAPGTYQSNWKLQNPQGGWFGIGPNGGAPFWVRIIVEPLPTATVTLVSPTASPTTTSTPTLQASGSVTLQPMQKFDLDQAGSGGGEDIAYETNASGQHLLIPQGSVVMAVMGSAQPGWGNCRTANMSAQPVVVENLSAGSYLCYRTSLGLPGWARLGPVNGNDGSLLLDYMTWSIP